MNFLAGKRQSKQWFIRPASKEAARLASGLRVSPLVGQLLINRGVEDVRSGVGFLSPKLTELIAPERMPGMAGAVGLVSEAIANGSKIVLYGDYDVDGITGVSILWQILKYFGATVDFYIPHRIDEGYGLNKEALESLAKAGTELLITIDCGISACDSVEMARQMGMKVVVTDHHRPGAKLPEADAIVHPLLDADYGNLQCCGAMVAYKLAWAIAKSSTTGQRLPGQLREFMLNATSLAAIGTIADVMDLRWENRVLTHFGLRSLPDCKLCGLAALIESADLTGQGVGSYDIGFRLAPLLNAAGRMGHARLAVELLTSDNSTRAMQIARYLKEQNETRRQYERKILKQACEQVADRKLNHPDRKTIVLAGESWHGGVIGIVASRVMEKYYKPTIMIDSANGLAKGSCRSVPGFDIHRAITACSEHLEGFGGHEMAAGIRLKTANIEAFAAALEEYARRNLSYEDTVDKLYIDGEACLGDFREKAVRELSMLEPFGQGNPRPIFAVRGLRLAGAPRKVGARGDHLQLVVTDNVHTIRCIGFRMGRFEKKLLENDFFSVACEPQINTYNGNSSVQLVLEDIRFD